MNKKLLLSVFLCFFIFLFGILAKESVAEQKQTDVDKTKIVEEWQTNPEAFAKLIFGDDLSVRSPRSKVTWLTQKTEKLKGYHVEWTLKFGISPTWFSLPEEFRRKSKIGNMGVYYLIGPDVSGWIGLRSGSRLEGTQEITWEQMTWGIPPQSEVHLKMKLKSVGAVIMKNGRLVIWVGGSELEIKASSKRCDWPEYRSPIYGMTTYEIRISSVHEFPVKVGLRSDDEGTDFIVPAKGAASVCVPSGKYDVYF